MAIQASAILSQAAQILNDLAGTRWPQAELLTYLNLVRRSVAAARPDLFVKTAAVKLAAGARQTLPADGHILIRLNTNMGTDGETVGKAISLASRQHLDNQSPSWQTAAESDTADCYMYDASNRLEFLVSPPNTGNGYVSLTYGAVPEDIADTDPIGFADVYQSILLDGVLAYAFSKDAEAGGNATLAAGYRTAFEAAIRPAAA